jgi:hypothetical protein
LCFDRLCFWLHADALQQVERVLLCGCGGGRHVDGAVGGDDAVGGDSNGAEVSEEGGEGVGGFAVLKVTRLCLFGGFF